MIEKVAKYIGGLLYEHDCVIVPGLGGFIANYREAAVDHTLGTIHPPSKEITFNPDLQVNDGLLINHISRKEHISYTAARDAVEEFAKNSSQILNKNEILALPKVGKLYKDIEHKLQFIPEATNFLIDSFGLPKVQFFPLLRTETNADKVALIENAKKLDVRRSSKSKSRPLWVPLAITAGILLLLSIPLIMNWPSSGKNGNKTAIESLENEKKPSEGLAALLDTGHTANSNKNTSTEKAGIKDVESDNNVTSEENESDETPKENNVDPNSDESSENSTVENSDNKTEVLDPSETEKNLNETPEETVPEVSENKNLASPVEPVKPPKRNDEALSPGAKEYIVVVGCFGVTENADKLATKIENAGYEVDRGKRGSLDRVGIKLRCAPSELNSKFKAIKDQFASGAWIL